MAKMKIRKKKDKFDALEMDWKDKVAAMSRQELDKLIADIAKEEVANLRRKKEDQQLKEAAQAHKDAGEVYREASKGAKLRSEFIVRVLGDRGAV